MKKIITKVIEKFINALFVNNYKLNAEKAKKYDEFINSKNTELVLINEDITALKLLTNPKKLNKKQKEITNWMFNWFKNHQFNYINYIDFINFNYSRHDLGLDSLDEVELIMDLESNFNIELNNEKLVLINTIEELVNLVIYSLRNNKNNNV